VVPTGRSLTGNFRFVNVFFSPRFVYNNNRTRKTVRTIYDRRFFFCFNSIAYRVRIYIYYYYYYSPIYRYWRRRRRRRRDVTRIYAFGTGLWRERLAEVCNARRRVHVNTTLYVLRVGQRDRSKRRRRTLAFVL